jgi:hypothetical protein
MGARAEAGIDVSKKVLDVAVRRDGEHLEIAQFDNHAAGHRKLIAWLTKGRRDARVVLESTGSYSLDVALALQRARGIEVMVANPRAVKQFAGALMQRSKTDVTAAVALQEYVARMPFVVWVPPASPVLALRGIARRIAALVVERARERNRLRALEATAQHSAIVRNDVEVNIRPLGKLCTGGRAGADDWLIHESAPVETEIDRVVAPREARRTRVARVSVLTGRTSLVAAAAGGGPGTGSPARTD